VVKIGRVDLAFFLLKRLFLKRKRN